MKLTLHSYEKKNNKQAYYDKRLKQIEIISRTHGKESNPSLTFLNNVASIVPTLVSLDNGDTITNPYGIANNFNYFAFIAETTKKV